MSEPGHTPLRPPLRTPAQPGDGRDPEIFDRLDAEIAKEDNAGKEAAPARRKPKPRAPARAAYRDARSRQNRPRPAKKSARPESEAFAAAKEMTARAAHEVRSQYGDRLTRDECLKLVTVFRAGLVPRRRAGRRPKPQVTAAYLDWKAGMRGVALFRKHIPRWEKHNAPRLPPARHSARLVLPGSRRFDSMVLTFLVNLLLSTGACKPTPARARIAEDQSGPPVDCLSCGQSNGDRLNSSKQGAKTPITIVMNWEAITKC